MPIAQGTSNAPEPLCDGIRVLLAEDDAHIRTLFATLLQQTAGVSLVLEAPDGADALARALQTHPHVAVFDFRMPRLDGIDAALALHTLQPAVRIALQSSDPDGLRASARGLAIPLFDKARSDDLVAWVEEQASSWHAIRRALPECQGAGLAGNAGLRCALCGYRTVSRQAPGPCPRCGAAAAWTAPSWSATTADETFAG
jgi:CheY-like chemotaxis protein